MSDTKKNKPQAKKKISLKDMFRLAKQNMKSGPLKNKIWAFICFGTAAALFIWWICILASF